MAAGANPGILLDGYRLCISCLWSKWLLHNLSSVCDGERNNKIRAKASTFRDGGKELWKVKREMTSDNFTNPTLHLVLGLNGLPRVELKQTQEAIHRTKCTNQPIEGHLPGTALGNNLLWHILSVAIAYLDLDHFNARLKPSSKGEFYNEENKPYIPGGERATS